jgi:hypothetical protein
LAQQNANIAEEAKKVLAALQGTWKLAIRQEVGKEGIDIGDPCTIKNDRLALQFPHRSLLNWSLLARVGPTTQMRIPASWNSVSEFLHLTAERTVTRSSAHRTALREYWSVLLRDARPHAYRAPHRNRDVASDGGGIMPFTHVARNEKPFYQPIQQTIAVGALRLENLI